MCSYCRFHTIIHLVNKTVWSFSVLVCKQIKCIQQMPGKFQDKGKFRGNGQDMFSRNPPLAND